MSGNNAENHPSANGFSGRMNYSLFPENVGILAMETYFPSQYVEQSKLEKFNEVSEGKYTIGLGQTRMGFCLDNEDINSICLTVLNNLFDNYGIDPAEIGRLDVGTETLIDKSKSIKTTLMRLFDKSGNTDVEGVDNINACFGGTAALFNAINWIESSYWDGRFACVVMGDIAVYAKGNARPTGGAGAVALLIGPNAPLMFERGLRVTHISHAYDFYKPVMDSEYPLVDGQLSVVCYLNALDKCYNQFKKKYKTLRKSNLLNDINNNNSDDDMSEAFAYDRDGFNLKGATGFLFHSPYCKLVQKSFARLLWLDYLEAEASTKKSLDKEEDELAEKIQGLGKYRNLANEETFFNKELERELMKLSEPLFKKKTLASLFLAKEIGNMYTPSLYGCLASHLLSKTPLELKNTRLCLFSYGSGLASSMFSIYISGNSTNSRFSLEQIHANLCKQKTKLSEQRIEIEPVLYDKYLQKQELQHNQPERQSTLNTLPLYPGTWYLKSIDDKYRRFYERKPASSATNQETFNSNQISAYLTEELSKL